MKYYEFLNSFLTKTLKMNASFLGFLFQNFSKF
jgi:hypothetical protein